MALFITVTPGITLSSTTLCDATTLNRLGTPTISIQGTIDGTAAVAIADGSITLAKIVNITGPALLGKGSAGAGAVTTLTIDANTLDGSSGIKVKDAGIGTTQLTNNGVTVTKLLQIPSTTLLGNPGTLKTAPDVLSFGSVFSLITPPVYTVSSRSKASGTATLVTTAAHGLQTGQYVTVKSVPDSTYNIDYVSVTRVDATTFTYAISDTTSESTTSSTGSVKRITDTTATTPTVVHTVDLNFGRLWSSAFTSTQDISNSTAWVDITGFNLTLTPRSSTPAIVLAAAVKGTCTYPYYGFLRIAQVLAGATTAVLVGDASGSKLQVGAQIQGTGNGSDGNIDSGVIMGVVSVNTSLSVSTRACSSTTATIVTSSAHGLTSGDKVTIRGVGYAYDVTDATITVTNATTFTYTSNESLTESTVSSAGTVYRPVQFKVQGRTSGGTLSINRSYTDGDSTSYGRAHSSLIALDMRTGA